MNLNAIQEHKILAHAIKSITESVIITDLQNNIIFVNDAFEKMYGYSKSEIRSLNIDVLRGGVNSEEQIAEIRFKTLNGGWSGELLNKKKDGSEILISLSTSVINDNEGKIIAAIGIAKDITLQKRFEFEKRKQTVLLQNIIDSLSYPFFIVDKNSLEIKIQNAKAKRDLSLDQESEWLINYIIPKAVTKINESGKEVIFEEVLISSTGEENFFKIFGYPVSCEGPHCSEIIIYYKIITDRKKREEEKEKLLFDLQVSKDMLEQNAEELAVLNLKLLDSERNLREVNEGKDKFFSILSHDLRSPFNGFAGLTYLLANEIDTLSKEEIVSFANNINDSAQALLQLIDDLFNWTLIESGKMSYVPAKIELKYVIDESFLLLKNNAAQKEITLTNNIPPNTFAFADPHMVLSVIQNLIANSIKFTRAKGSVNVDYSTVEDFIEVTVSDNGIGIDEENIKRLFKVDSIYSSRGTENEKGTGLGLILCKELVEKNWGKIWIESKPNEGTKITFSLPKNREVLLRFLELTEEMNES